MKELRAEIAKRLALCGEPVKPNPDETNILRIIEATTKYAYTQGVHDVCNKVLEILDGRKSLTDMITICIHARYYTDHLRWILCGLVELQDRDEAVQKRTEEVRSEIDIWEKAHEKYIPLINEEMAGEI